MVRGMDLAEKLDRVDPTVLLTALVLVLGGLLLVAVVRLAWVRGGPRRLAKARAERASMAERRAEALLERRGYRVVDRQARTRFPYCVDGERDHVDLRADLIVQRRRRRFVAEVKSGRMAPQPRHGATRRQLLEYRLAFDVDGILLVEPEHALIREVRFPTVETKDRGRAGRMVWPLVALAATAALAWWLSS
jgi:Holliday junction resolvase-like predicted endonuclease